MHRDQMPFLFQFVSIGRSTFTTEAEDVNDDQFKKRFTFPNSGRTGQLESGLNFLWLHTGPVDTRLKFSLDLTEIKALRQIVLCVEV